MDRKNRLLSQDLYSTPNTQRMVRFWQNVCLRVILKTKKIKREYMSNGNDEEWEKDTPTL